MSVLETNIPSTMHLPHLSEVYVVTACVYMSHLLSHKHQACDQDHCTHISWAGFHVIATHHSTSMALNFTCNSHCSHSVPAFRSYIMHIWTKTQSTTTTTSYITVIYMPQTNMLTKLHMPYIWWAYIVVHAHTCKQVWSHWHQPWNQECYTQKTTTPMSTRNCNCIGCVAL